MEIRLNQKSEIQINFDGIWRNLVVFSDSCPYGKFGYKTGAKKPFNPFFFIQNESHIKTIQSFISN